MRINPNEIHINDPEYYEEIYTAGTRKRNKDVRWCEGSGETLSTLTTIDHEQHRMRRRALGVFFSKRSISFLAPVIAEKVDILVERFANHVQTQTPVRLDVAFTALTMDVITEYAFANCSNYLSRADYQIAWKNMLHQSFQIGPIIAAFPWYMLLFHWLPASMRQADEGMKSALEWQAHARNEIERILDPTLPDKDSSTRTIFHEIRDDSELPPNEKTPNRLTHEATLITGAGSETTAKALSTIVYFLCRRPQCAQRLIKELLNVEDIQEPAARYAALEQCEYLVSLLRARHENLH